MMICGPQDEIVVLLFITMFQPITVYSTRSPGTSAILVIIEMKRLCEGKPPRMRRKPPRPKAEEVWA